MSEYINNQPKYSKTDTVVFVQESDPATYVGTITNIKITKHDRRNRILYTIDCEGDEYEVSEGYVDRVIR